MHSNAPCMKPATRAHHARIGADSLFPTQGLEAMECQLHIFVPVHLEDVAPFLVYGQSPLHVSPIKLEVIQYLQSRLLTQTVLTASVQRICFIVLSRL